MATNVQIDLQTSNTEYANAFDKGELALPPAKHYLVGESLVVAHPSPLSPLPRNTPANLPLPPPK